MKKKILKTEFNKRRYFFTNGGRIRNDNKKKKKNEIIFFLNERQLEERIVVGQVISKDRIEIQRNDSRVQDFIYHRSGIFSVFLISRYFPRFTRSRACLEGEHTRYPFVSRNPVIQSVGSESVFPLRISTAAGDAKQRSGERGDDDEEEEEEEERRAKKGGRGDHRSRVDLGVDSRKERKERRP